MRKSGRIAGVHADAGNNNDNMKTQVSAAASKSEDERAVNVCVVCDKENQRVTVVCATCTQSFHLGCLKPPLRRRPVLVDGWKCASCEVSTTTKTITVKTTETRAGRRREKIDDVTVTSTAEKKVKIEKEEVKMVSQLPQRKRRTKKDEPDPQVADGLETVKLEEKMEVVTEETKIDDQDQVAIVMKKRRVSTRTTNETQSNVVIEKSKIVAQNDVITTRSNVNGKGKTRATKSTPANDQETDDDSDRPLAANLHKKPSGKARMQKNSKVRSSMKVKLGTRTTVRTNGRKTTMRYNGSAEYDDEEEDNDDDDDDSDFVEENDSESDDYGTEEATDDEFVTKTKKLPKLKATPTKRGKQSNAKANGKSSNVKRRPANRDANGSRNEVNANMSEIQNGNNDADANTADESAEEEDIQEPRYYVEYTANSRSKCKSCEQKLEKDSIRIGVRLRHSMFGITTYFKHLKCSQICWSTARSLTSCTSKCEDESEPNEDKESNNFVPIDGFESLRPEDQKLVQEHMMSNEESGVIDERSALVEDHYNKKMRMPEKDPSPQLTVPLLPYQREALAWMTAQEKSVYKGGILADEMGMGKTIQAISLILEKVRLDDPPSVKKSKGRNPQIIRGGTLVVCPLVAVMQWKSEIERFVERNHLSIYIHHGNKRLDSPAQIASYDIVLTTYSIIESEVRKMLGWEKVVCVYCKRKYLPEKLVFHHKYFCGPNAKKTSLQNKQKTKRAKKRAAGDEDSDEEDDYPKKPAPKGKRGAKAKKVPSDDEDDIDEIETSQPKKTKGKSPLHQIHWTRIVLDEAHYIKDRKCNTARGVFELKSEYKWCLTGTPLQNRIGELFSLVRFLQVKYYAYYHCGKCECQMLDFKFPDGKCPQCSHAAMHHFSFFNKKIVVPIQCYGYVAEGKVAMLRLQNEVLQHILLRRTKEGRADDICLPPKLIRIRKDCLDERENDFYEAIYTQSQAQFNTYVSSGTLLNNYAHIFDLLIRLRQAVDHPYLVIFSKSNPALQLPTSSSTASIRPVVEELPLHTTQDDDSNGSEARLCTICHEDLEDVVVAKCGHEFCRECVKEFIESLPMGAEATCPSCSELLTIELPPEKNPNDAIPGSPDIEAMEKTKQPLKPVDLSAFHKNSILHRVSNINSFQTSTKIEALMQELELMRVRDPSGKAIIFSQFVNMLDIIQHRLQLGGIKCVKLSGNMSMDVRDRTIKAFREDVSINAFLISLKAGGVALNLTVASHIFLMDPWWNPAAENQAIDRTHRLGQFKPIQATRFIIAGTVEERILKLQEKKRLIFEGTVGASVSAISRLTEEDLRFLFSR